MVETPPDAETAFKLSPPVSPACILVVEDEEIVRRFVVRKLRQQGYAVLEASSGREAADRLREHAAPLDLVVTDVVMPEMNGREVVQKVRRLHPEAKALYMSGYPEEIIAHRGILETGIDFIEKTSLGSALVAKVRQLLGPRR